MRALGWALVLVALATILSPLGAVLVGTGLDRGALVTAFAAQDERGPLVETLVLAGVAFATALGLGFPFALLAGGTRSPVRQALLALGVLVLAVPPYLAAAAWIDLLGPAGRITRPVAHALGLASLTPDEARLGVYRFAGFVYTPVSAGIVLGACLFPLVLVAVASAERRLDPRIVEAARLARGRWGVLRVRAVLLGGPALGGAVLAAAAALTDFAVPQVLRVRTVGEDVFSRVQENDLAGAAALGLPLVLLVLLAGGAGAFLLERRRFASAAALEGEAPVSGTRRATLAGHALALSFAGVALAPGLAFPIASLGIQAAASAGPRSEGAVARAWETVHDDARRTVLLAALAATLATLLAAPIGRLLARPGRARAGLVGLLALGLAVPAPVVGLGLVVLWNRDVTVGPLHVTAWVYDGPAVVVLAWLARFLPAAVLLARSAFARVPGTLEEAAALEGRGALGRLRRVVLPLAAPGLVAAWVSVYVLSATEFGATVLVVPPGRPLLAPTVVNQVHYGQDAVIAASALILLLAVAQPLVPLGLVAAWRARRTARTT